MRKMIFGIACVGAFFVACGSGISKSGMMRNYQGVFPGANTPILYDLHLGGGDKGGTFDLSMAYGGKGEGIVYESEGDWTLLTGEAAKGNGAVYQLVTSDERPDTTYFLYMGDSLRLLDRSMKAIESDLNYTLQLVK